MKLNEKKLSIIFVLLCCALAIFLAIIQPNNFGPDESMKMSICDFIAKYNSLPDGGDERVRSPEWGTSYAFTPILQYIFAGVFIKIISVFTRRWARFLCCGKINKCNMLWNNGKFCNKNK